MSASYQNASIGIKASDSTAKDEYVSFQHVVRSNNPQKKKASDASEYSFTNTPAFKKELSLFPLFDKFLLYTPTYVIKNRSKKIHIPILILITIIFIIRAFNHVIYFIAIDDKYNTEYSTEIFVALMFILPFINNIIRIRYFLKYFNWTLWHYPSYINPKSGIKTINTQIFNKLSFLLRRPAYLKNKISKNFRIGWFCIMAIIFASIIFRILLWDQHSQTSIIKVLEVSSITAWTCGIIWAFIYGFCFDMPDLLMLLVARIHFTECQLYITHFTQELITMSLDEIVESNLFEKYLIMYKNINDLNKPFYYFIIIMSFEVLIGIWYGITYILSIKTWSNGNNISLWIIFWILSTLVILLQLIFALWPAIKMTELNNILIENVNDKIDDIMINRQTFHDENMLNDFMDIVCKQNINNSKHKKSFNTFSYSRNLSRYNTMKFNDKTIELKDKISKYSIQKESLMVLNQLLNAIENNPCSYKLIGITIDKYSIRDIII
eukprot:249696_1